eukprot:1291400-Amphidinium_carterae.2
MEKQDDRNHRQPKQQTGEPQRLGPDWLADTVNYVRSLRAVFRFSNGKQQEATQRRQVEEGKSELVVLDLDVESEVGLLDVLVDVEVLQDKREKLDVKTKHVLTQGMKGLGPELSRTGRH